MKNKRMEMWVDETTGDINVIECDPLFGVPGALTVPLWDDIEQRMMLNNGDCRVEVVVYNKVLSMEVIKNTVRQVLAGNAREW